MAGSDAVTMPERARAIRQIAVIVCRGDLGHPTRVAIDGVTASGKSTLAREITGTVAELGRPAVHLTMDGYHHPREHRYRQGRMSARGYYDDAAGQRPLTVALAVLTGNCAHCARRPSGRWACVPIRWISP